VAIIYGMPDSEYQLVSMYPKSVENFDDIDRVHKELINELKQEQKGFFGKISRWKKKRQLEKFEENKKDPFYPGAKGELEVLQTLSKLNDNYYVFCGLDIELRSWLSYQGERNLKSAQMDFVVVSRRGVILIEVKNWSTKYLKEHDQLSPHEQTERAGKVLWAFLQTGYINPRVTNILLPIQNNMKFNPDYKYVSISKLNEINSFIENRGIELSENAFNEIVDILRAYYHSSDKRLENYHKIALSDLKVKHDFNLDENNQKEKKYSIKEIQKKYPMAYEAWTESDDEFLKKFWNDKSNKQSRNEKIQELSKKLGRKRGGIQSRLKKKGLD